MFDYNFYTILRNIIESEIIPVNLFEELLRSYDLSFEDFENGEKNQEDFSRSVIDKLFGKENRNYHTIISKDNFNNLTNESNETPILLYTPLNDHSRSHLSIGDILFSYRSGQFRDLDNALRMRGIYGLGIALSNPLKISDEYSGRNEYKNYGIIVIYPYKLIKHLSVRNIQLNPNTIDLTPYNGNRNDSLQYIPDKKHYTSLLGMLLYENPHFKTFYQRLNLDIQKEITPETLWSKKNSSELKETKNYLELFKKWLNGQTELSSKTTINYISALNTLNRTWNEDNEVKIDIWNDPYYIKNEIGESTLLNNPSIISLNREQNHSQSEAINYYFRFLDELTKTEIIGINRLYFGAPGTGKSYSISEYIRDNGIPEYNEKSDFPNVFRVTLHPEYTYSDFVGQIMPVSIPVKGDKDRTRIEYRFTPQIFTLALKRAFKKEDEPIFLVLEEMSRANVAAVFGDLFQLLDRDENGESEYRINNSLIADEIWSDQNKKIYLPKNLFILGTVNTSDQNVFIMDTAFKRRFEFEYIDAQDIAKDENGQPLNNFTFNFKTEQNEDITVDWITFYTTLNEFITSKNEQGLGLTEDKQVGQFFIKFRTNDVDYNYNQFKNKLLEYLWNDIEGASFSDLKLFDNDIVNFSQAYRAVDEQQNIFSAEFLGRLLEKQGNLG